MSKENETKTEIKEETKENEQNLFVKDTSENIETGAKIVQKKATEIASDMLSKFKEGLTVAFEKGSELASNAYEKASDYTEEYKEKHAIKKVQNERNELLQEFGLMILEDKAKLNSTKLFGTKKIKDILKRIEDVELKIEELEKELDEK
ncbi:MAG: hypothetical protein U9N34_10520 [Candidatus Cloacimonadota bacterium]|nr:hypothetical protein [Candidatus Cloacimonadota bacterium]